VLDLITDPPKDDPYQQLKDRLCTTHQLTDFKRLEKLHQMDALGGRRPSDLLHEMTELCPTGYEESPFFLFLFLQRLPNELRIVLGEADNHEDVQATAAKADKLWSLHNHQQHGMVAGVDSSLLSLPSPPSATIAVVKPGQPMKGGHSGGQHGKGCCHVCTCQAFRLISCCSGVAGVHGQGLGGLVLLPLAVWRRGDSLQESVQMAGKLAFQGYLNAVTPGYLFHIMDQVFKRFLVNTGASYSIFPHHSSSPPTSPLLAGP
jgi:hypothetical protein